MTTETTTTKPPKVKNKAYQAEVVRLQEEFVKVQEWVKETGARIVVL
ncbi:MAG: polyphosphate kinase 2, partial [Acidimicrobiia bacterium]|nr:polyphosphate kinase 2 [Acidimicrobiia bacterium]